MNFSKAINNDIALDTQIRIVLSSYFKNANTNNPDRYTFRCNVCGDSKKSQSKKRGYILKNKYPWSFYCHNCFASMTAVTWLKEYFPFNYKAYVSELLRSGTPEYSFKKHFGKEVDLIEEKKEKIKKLENAEKKDVKCFVPILKGTGELFDIAKNECIKRLIPEEIWHSWYVAIDETYKNRLIIPFKDQNNKIYYWQGRALYDHMIPKYLSRGGEFNNIYNYYTVNKLIPVMILEGCIDSLFISNSIALTGLKIEDIKLKEFKHRFWILDDDNAGNQKSCKLLDKGENVFVWHNFLKDLGIGAQQNEKWDINKLTIYLNKKDKFIFDQLKNYFTNSIYSKALFPFKDEKINKWAKQK